MSDITDENDRRATARVDLWRMMFLRVGDSTFTGLLHDVSPTGAKFVFDDGQNEQSRLGPGDEGIIVIDGIGELPGTLVRFDGNDAVFTSVVSDDDQQQIVAKIMIAVNEIEGVRPES